MVSSYVNTTRAILRLWASEPQEAKALLLETGPLASYRMEMPRSVTRLSLAAALASRFRESKADRERPVTDATAAFQGWRTRLAADPDGSLLAPALSGAKFVQQLEKVHLPGLVGTILAVDSLANRFGVKQLIVGNEFGASERAAIHYAHAHGLASDACQHGIIDGHYRRERLIADVFWTWDRASRDMMARWGAASPDRLRELPATGRPARGNAVTGRRRDVVLFSQPYQLIPLPPEDLIAETVPVLERVCRNAGARLVLKPHPLQTKRQLAAWFSGNTLPRCDSRSPMEVLATAAVAVALDSSVVIDCRAAAVPCIGVGWYPGHYGKELEDLGYLVRARSPEHLESLVARELEQRGD
jgi:hypothetical protein